MIVPARAAASAIAGLAAAGLAACTVLGPGPRLGATIERDFSIEAEDALDADVAVVFYGGRMRVGPGEAEQIARLVAVDNLEQVEPRCEERREGSHVAARLWLDSERRIFSGDDARKNEWTVELGTRVPIDLDLGLAACNAEVELGGVALRRAHVSLAAGEATLRFSRPNPRELDRLELEVGAGTIHVHDLGNARCRSISVEASAGSFDLDCDGAWPESALMHIEAGMGGVQLTVPRDLSVHIDAAQTTFGEVKAPDFVDEGGHRFRARDVPEGAPELKIELEVSFGSVTIVRS